MTQPLTTEQKIEYVTDKIDHSRGDILFFEIEELENDRLHVYVSIKDNHIKTRLDLNDIFTDTTNLIEKILEL